MFWRVQIAVAVVAQLDNCAYTHPCSLGHHIEAAAEHLAENMVAVQCDEVIAEEHSWVWQETTGRLQTSQHHSVGRDLCLDKSEDHDHNVVVVAVSHSEVDAEHCGYLEAD